MNAVWVIEDEFVGVRKGILLKIEGSARTLGGLDRRATSGNHQ
jgi:hypothetical protein